MPRYALQVEYDGAPFVGWQRQDGLPTVQGAIQAALAKLEPDVPTIAAAGRTDTGVHAWGQVAHCDMAGDWEAFRLSEALNFHLKPHPIAIRAAACVAQDWHARFSATERRYTYVIACRRAPLAIGLGRAWQIKGDLDAEAMQSGSQVLVGHHDFTTFRATNCQAKGPMKTLDAIDVDTVQGRGGPEIHVHFRARSFLHNQVRSMVGSIERVGAGKWTANDLRTALEAKDRAACGTVAPSDGLYLTGVGYVDDPFA